MLNKLFILFFFTSVLFCSKKTYATHGAGLDISYECINRGSTSDSYKIIVKFYRDCSSSSTAASNFFLEANSSCGSSLTLLPQVSGPTFITPLCPGSSAPCSNGGLVELEEYIYEAIISLDHCSDWVINVCASGNRNNAITTIISPANQDLCVEAEINNLNVCNNSPSFSEYPAPYICIGQTYCYNNGAVDIEGDSLMYSLTNPLNGWGGVTYVAGYSPSNPIAGTTTFDEFTGDLCMNATQNQVSVIAMKITEYRNGVKIGSVTRDIQIIVLACSTTPPILTGFNGSPQNVTNSTPLDDSLHFCATGSNALSVTIEAPLGSSNNKNMSWSAIAGTNAAFTVSNNNSSNPIGTLSWTPQYIDVANSPYTFSVVVEDDACPVNNLFTYTYTISLSSALDFDIISSTISPSCAGYSDASINLVVAGTTGQVAYSWLGPGGFTSSNQNINSITSGLYYVGITDDAGCSTSDTVEIQDPPSLTVIPTVDSVSCIGSNDGAISIVVTPNTSNLTYNWLGPNGFSSTNQNINLLYSGIYDLTITDATGCIYDYQIILPPANPFNVSFNIDSISCYNENDGAIDLILSVNSSLLTFNWVSQNGFSSTNEDIDSLYSGIYIVTINDQNGCAFVDTVILNNPDPITSESNTTSCDNYIWNNNNYNTSGTYSFSTVSSNGCDSTSIINLVINNSTSSTENKTVCDEYEWNGTTYTTSGTYTFTTSNIYGCDSTATLNLNVNSSTFSNMYVNDCKPFIWNNITYDSSGIYTFNTVNSAGCDSIATINLNITSYDISLATPICVGDSSALSVKIFNPLSNTYNITINDNFNAYSFVVDSFGLLKTTNNLVYFSPQSTNQYSLTYVKDGNNCESNPNKTITLTVNPLPTINIFPLQVCANDKPFNLNYATPNGGEYIINNQSVDMIKPQDYSVGDYEVEYYYTDSSTSCSSIKKDILTIKSIPFSDFYCSEYVVKQDTPITFYSSSDNYSSLFWIVENDVFINDSLTFVYNYEDTGTYIVKLITENDLNCTDTASREIIILPSYTVYIPNTFSPNNDGINDLFYPVGEGILEFKISIYNRWGNQIYSGSANTPWSGEDLPDGKYAYVIEIINLRNTPFKYFGNVLLIK